MRRAPFDRRTPDTKDPPDREYWLSYSDLMAGLLMAFALMLMAALYREGEQDCKITVADAIAESIRQVLEGRKEVLKKLREEFESSEQVIVAPDGTVTFAGGVLFEQASADVSSRGRSVLTAFAEEYFEILLDDPEIKGQLKRVVVEGHTNSDGSYELNLDLSHSRSLAVMLVLLDAAGPNERGLLENLVTANGRSFADLVLSEDGAEDKKASRRIEIRFHMDDEPIVNRVLALDSILTDPESQCNDEFA